MAVFLVKIAAACATLLRAGYLDRAEGAVFTVVIVFAFANVAFDTVVFVLHKKDLLLKSLYIMDQRRFFIRFINFKIRRSKIPINFRRRCDFLRFKRFRRRCDFLRVKRFRRR